jgi:hypothetical protein
MGFGGEERRMKDLGRGKPLFGSFKKHKERFWGGGLEGLFYLILKFPQIGGFWRVNYKN